MFTGLVECTGEIRERTGAAGNPRLRIHAPDLAEELTPGESIAVDGVCLTVTSAKEGSFDVDVGRVTLERTTLGSVRPGRLVNLERALRVGDRLGGHFVQGHVDGVGEVREVEAVGETVFLRVALPPVVEELSAERGSLAVNGVSLTVARLEGGVAEFAIIPYTWDHTALRQLGPGSQVNLEADLVARYLRRGSEPHHRSCEGGDPSPEEG